MPAPEYDTSAPVKVYKETDIFKSSNTWEFLIFEQLRTLRNIEYNVFRVPNEVQFHLMSLILCLIHLESLLYDKIDPLRNGTSESYLRYLQKKPVIFKSLDTNVDGVRALIRKDEMTQLMLVAKIEKWFLALDEYMGGIKRIQSESFDMELPKEEELETVPDVEQ